MPKSHQSSKHDTSWSASWRVDCLDTVGSAAEKGQFLATLATEKGVVAAAMLLDAYNKKHDDGIVVCLSMLAHINAEGGVGIDSPLSDAILHFIHVLQ